MPPGAGRGGRLRKTGAREGRSPCEVSVRRAARRRTAPCDSRPLAYGSFRPLILFARLDGELNLYADLDNVARIVGRVVQTLDRNPDILTQVLKTVDVGVNSLTGPQPASRRE